MVNEKKGYEAKYYEGDNGLDIYKDVTKFMNQFSKDEYTEKIVYHNLKLTDLRLDLLPQIRQMAINHAGGKHLWGTLGDMELLKSAGLYSWDRIACQSGFNLAAVMLLGKDNVIKDVCPAYVTDAIVRRVNIDRYDDRQIVQTNLIESYEKLMDFAIKHLPDKFYLEGSTRISLINIIAREMIANTLIHREFSSSYIAKFVIEKNRMYVENANRALKEGVITPDNLEPNPKNPIIAAFFRTIGWSEQLGSGVRNLYHYSKIYSNKDPEFIEGDIFRIVVPLDDSYSYDREITNGKLIVDPKEYACDPKDDPKHLVFDPNNDPNDPKDDENMPKHDPNEFDSDPKDCANYDKEKSVLSQIKEDPYITRKQLAEETGLSDSTVKRVLAELRNKNRIERIGSKRSGYWKVLE